MPEKIVILAIKVQKGTNGKYIASLAHENSINRCAFHSANKYGISTRINIHNSRNFHTMDEVQPQKLLAVTKVNVRKTAGHIY